MRRWGRRMRKCFLLLLGSFHRTCSRTCAAINALFGVDHVFSVFLGNRADRTSVGAGTATDTFFGVNYIRHNLLLFSTAKIYSLSKCM